MYVGFYGSLRFPPTREGLGITNHITYMGQASIPALMYDLGSFPGIRLGNGLTVLDVYETDSDWVIERLDGFEGYHPDQPDRSLYIRRDVPVRLPEHPMPLVVAVYEYNSRNLVQREIVENGDWVRYLHNKGRQHFLGKGA